MPHKPPFHPDPKLFPFRSRWFESATGGRVHYVDEGEGPPILMLHGNPTWSFLFRGMIIRLRRRFRCIALDYPGFGLSEHPEGYGYTPQEHADVVLEMVRFLDLRDMTVVGHDWGGPIGLKTALDEKARVRALVMGNTWYWPARAKRMLAFSYIMSSEPVQNMITKRNMYVERLLPRGLKHEVSPEVMDHYRGPFPTPASRESIAVLPRQITGASFWLEELAHSVPRMLGEVPLLLTWGAHDVAFPPRFMDRWREDFRSVTTRRLDAKHYFPEDAPAEASDAVEAFLTAPEAAADADCDDAVGKGGDVREAATADALAAAEAYGAVEVAEREERPETPA